MDFIVHLDTNFVDFYNSTQRFLLDFVFRSLFSNYFAVKLLLRLECGAENSVVHTERLRWKRENEHFIGFGL